jgi:hypothetical protein
MQTCIKGQARTTSVIMEELHTLFARLRIAALQSQYVTSHPVLHCSHFDHHTNMNEHALTCHPYRVLSKIEHTNRIVIRRQRSQVTARPYAKGTFYHTKRRVVSAKRECDHGTKTSSLHRGSSCRGGSAAAGSETETGTGTEATRVVVGDDGIMQGVVVGHGAGVVRGEDAAS